ncbi:hypothetical protein DM01DRAFT_1337419 [Hesseltinella vesiculosa]|uniref:Uncharacterized protein n=1 Tax=Hesseltinella vesiculosa TaxID=101127 RepID=A0A1X2GCM7_9FUNG|nr:hypothetical protein DM01DRAFT_1337419 [Hesseltinella vesiculosa]
MPPLNALLQVTDQVPIARCSDCKCKRPLVHFEGRRYWHLTCIRCRTMNFMASSVTTLLCLSKCIFLTTLSTCRLTTFARHFIVHLYETSGFMFYLKLIHDPSRRSDIAFYASCTSSSVERGA